MSRRGLAGPGPLGGPAARSLAAVVGHGEPLTTPEREHEGRNGTAAPAPEDAAPERQAGSREEPRGPAHSADLPRVLPRPRRWW